jgi:hypothetical protein
VIGGLQLNSYRRTQSNSFAGILPRSLLAKLKVARRRMQSKSCGAPQSNSLGKCSCAAAARETKLSNQADNAAFGDSGLSYRFRAALRLIKSLVFLECWAK